MRYKRKLFCLFETITLRMYICALRFRKIVGNGYSTKELQWGTWPDKEGERRWKLYLHRSANSSRREWSTARLRTDFFPFSIKFESPFKRGMELKDLFFLLRKIFARGTIIARAAYYCSFLRRRDRNMIYMKPQDGISWSCNIVVTLNCQYVLYRRS